MDISGMIMGWSWDDNWDLLGLLTWGFPLLGVPRNHSFIDGFSLTKTIHVGATCMYVETPQKKRRAFFCGELRLLKSLRTHPFLFHLGFHFYATPLGAESVGDTGIVLLCFCWKWKVSHIVFHHIPGPHEKRPWSCRSRRWNLRTATRKVVAHQPMELHISHTRPADPTTCAGREVGSKRWTKTRQFRWE